jgi:prepilin-type N-terminal cleavage/methylation domain-containing protein
MQTHSNQISQKAFTLVEVAIVLVIVGLAIGGILSTLSAQVEQQKFNETRNTINNVKEALLGYAMANGRFPCPALQQTTPPTLPITAVESPSNASTGVACTNYLNGYVPGVTLGLTPTDTYGYVLDGWNNPVRYAIADVRDTPGAASVFTNSNGMKNANSGGCPSCGMSWLSNQVESATVPVVITANQTLLSICNTASNITVRAACQNVTSRLTETAVLVVYSTGKNFKTIPAGAGIDEQANLNNDAAFISHEPYAAGAANGEFDDIVEWISPNSIFSRLVQANQLP